MGLLEGSNIYQGRRYRIILAFLLVLIQMSHRWVPGEFTPVPNQCSAAEYNSMKEEKMLHKALLPYTTAAIAPLIK